MADDEHQPDDEQQDSAIEAPPIPDGSATRADQPGVEADDALAVAEVVAAREAEAEAAGEESPKVLRPRARTSRKAPATDDPAGAGAPAGAAIAQPATPMAGQISVIPPAVPASAGRAFGGDSLTLHQASLQEATARAIDIRQGAVGRATADDIAISQGAIGFARGDRVSVEMGAIGGAIGGEVRLTQAAAGTILAREARIEQAGVRTIIANHVHVERTTGVLFLIARRVDGDVRAILDWRGALAFGAAFGVVASLLRRRSR